MENEKPTEYRDIILTDIQLHTTEIRKPVPWYRAIWRSIKNKMPGRFYGRDIQFTKDGRPRFVFDLPPALKKEMKEAEKAGQKIRFWRHKDGIPVLFSKDTIERLKANEEKNSKNKTRVWRSES